MPLDRTVYNQLLEILKLSERGDTETQKYVHENLANFQQNRKDVSLYYLEASLGASTFHSKQMALLLLKNSILQNWTQTDIGIQNLIKNEIIKIVNLKEPQLRNVVATCYVSIFNVEGYDKWQYGIENLMNIISNLNNDVVVETATVTLNMILEDTFTPGYPMSPNYLNYLKNTFLTQLFQVAQKSSTGKEIVSRILLVLMESNSIFEHLVGELFNHFWNLLGNMASLDNYSVKKCVIKGMHKLWDFSPLTILQSSDAIFPFVTKLCSDEVYTIQIDALDFYTHILQSQICTQGSQNNTNEELKNLLLNKMNKEFPVLLKTLVDNTKYSSWDYMSMDRTHLEDDNSNIPDDMQDVPIKNREDEETNTWGNTWTVRKGSALLLDTISQLYCQNTNNQVIKVLLGYIQEKLDSTDWELKESGVLTLGAISKGALYSLFPYLPRVLEYLIVTARDRKPLMRIISCWCLSRFVEWIFIPENAPNYLEKTLMTILECMVDRNKRVQESACSSFTSFEEFGTTLLLPYVGRIMQVILKCLEMYQKRNFMILYDVIGTLYQNVGEQVINDPNHVVLIQMLLKKLESTEITDLQFPALLECVSSVVSILGNKLPMGFIEKLTKLSVLSLYQLLAEADLEMNNQIAEILSDTISILLTTPSNSRALSVNNNYGNVGVGYDLTNVVLTVINNVKMTNNVDLITVINELCNYKTVNVLQSSIALLGDLSNSKFPLNDQTLSVLVNNVQYYLNTTERTNSINSNASTTSTVNRYNSVQSNYQNDTNDLEEYFGVINNCVWVFGVLCDNQINIYNNSNIDLVLILIVKIINNCNSNLCILQNCCVTLGKFSKHFPGVTIKYINSFLNPLCQHLLYSKNDKEKMNTILSVSNLVLLHVQQSTLNNNPNNSMGLNNSARVGIDDLDYNNLVILFKLYISSCKGTLENFGDTFGTNSELVQLSSKVMKAVLQHYPKLDEYLDINTKQQIHSFIKYSK